MELILQAIGWLPEPWGGIALAFMAMLGSMVFFASLIVPLTKTPKDDEIVKALLARFSLFLPKK